ncbi:helix-turn-helix domain-containing protein [Streptomyces sp. NPDC088560]|uniref:helix-turn-helix domain-containing protein n=1 Tax=Streptomyces sp. NPDC088560 TaxID=3365868 RepID=UPI003826B856
MRRVPRTILHQSKRLGYVGTAPRDGSAARLRALVRRDVGIALAGLRRWGRLRAAIAGLPAGPAALAAATAGFADQAHLTRTARDFIGRTPASLRPAKA